MLFRSNEPAGKHRSGRTRHGSKWPRVALVEAGQAAGRSKNTYLAAQSQRLRRRWVWGCSLQDPDWLGQCQ